MDDGALYGAIDRVVDALLHQHGAAGNDTTAESFRQDHDVRPDVKLMSGQECPGTIHAGLYFVEDEQSSVALAEALRFRQVLGRGNVHTSLGLDRFHDERSKLPRSQFCGELLDIVEGNRLCILQQRPEAVAPERVVHKRQRPAGQAVECAFGIEQAISAGARARKLDGSFHAFAARAAEEYLFQVAASQTAELRCEFAGELRNMALQHRGPGAVQFIFQRGQDRRMIVPGIVNAVAGEEVENACSFRGDEFDARAALVTYIHLENVQQFYPLWIDVLTIERERILGDR